MINLQSKSSGFITLTVTLIIIILMLILGLNTGRMLMNEQRTAANELRYQESMSAAQAGLEAAMARLSVDNTYRTKITNAAGVPYYQVTFGSDVNIQTGANTLPVVSLTSVGTSGYSANATDSTTAEAQVTLHEQVLIGRVVSGTPDAPLTVAAGMAAGGNFSVAANPNGGGPGVPLSIWSPEAVYIDASSSTCGQQEYEEGDCSLTPYSDNKSGAGSDILQDDPNFPDNLLEYAFGVSTITDLVSRLNQLGRSVLSNCNTLDATSTGLYIVHGECTPNVDLGSKENPIVLVVWDGNLTINGNTNIYGIVFAYSSGASSYNVKLNGTATVYGALLANDKMSNTNGSYNAVYDAEVLKNIEEGSSFSYTARVSGSWRDW